MRFYHVLVVVLCGFLKRSFAQDRNLTDYRTRSRAYDLEHKYNLTHARKGRHAVREAVNFLMGQEEVAKSSLVTPANVKKNRTKCLSKDDCPVCVVSMTAIINEGTFEYQGVDALPPYPAKCWSQSVRYHVAPECEREEASRGVIPIYKWRWTLQSAKDGYCVMPNPSPPEVAQAYFHRAEKLDSIISPAANSNTEKASAPKKKELVVLMLGLSFMGQPWQSLGCLYSDLVVGGAMSTEKTGGELVLPVLDIKKNGGVCSGYPLSKIPYYHPPELHQNYTTPTQNSESCSADHAYAVYGSKDPSQPTAKVCFVYTFNVEKNVKPGSPLPW